MQPIIRLVVFASVAGGAPALADKRITLEVQKADVTSVLRVFAELMHVNLVVADEVKGQVTISLRNVRAGEAFSAVLQAQGLGFEYSGPNIMRVAPLRQLTEEAEAREKLAAARKANAPLQTRLIRVSYANAADLLPHVKALLSERGSVTVDVRTNTLIVRDIAP